VDTLEGGNVLMDIVTGDGRRRVVPALVESKYGNGRVIYCASSVESLFAGNQEWVLGDLIRDIVLRAAGEPKPYEVEGPESLVTNLTAKGARRVLHLTNWTGDGFEKSHVGRYYVAPVENVRIRIPAAAQDVHSYPAQGMTQRRKGASLELTIPRVGGYQALTWVE
jgi:hypothetical protein